MNNKILILEDNGGGELRTEAFRKNIPSMYELTFAHRAADAISQLALNTFFAIFLDHDVPDPYGISGRDVAVFLAIRSILSPGARPKIIIHSRNIYGATAMKQLLPDAICWPGIWDFPAEIENILNC